MATILMILTFMVSNTIRLSKAELTLVGPTITADALRQRVTAFDVDDWISQRGTDISRGQKPNSLKETLSRLHNPYAGISYAWQLTETVDDFLKRLPPQTTYSSEELPWIYICNPYLERVPKSQGKNQFSRGNEDEGPEIENCQLDHVLAGAMERLGIVKSFEESSRSVKRPAATISRELIKERKQASTDILMLAHAGNVRTGKVSRLLLICRHNVHITLTMH